METLKIEIPKGFEVADFNKETGVVQFQEKPKSVFERIKTLDDVFKYNNTSIEEIDEMFKHVPGHFKHQHIAELICKSLNEGWEADWNDDGQYKYYPWFKMSSSGFRYDGFDYWHSFSHVGSRLCFKSSELAKYAGTQFTAVYENFMTIKTTTK